MAFVNSLPAGIGAIVFFIVYQQAENHLLQPVILSRTVKLNPLTVLLAILIATEVAGILGALLAIPVTGIIQIVLKDIWTHRGGRPPGLPVAGRQQPREGRPVRDPETPDGNARGAKRAARVSC
ncbi:AI-2E family transporter [Streptomyces canarius]